MRLLNNYEELTYDKLEKVCKPEGARVFPKVRIADILKIDKSGLDKELYTFALKSHFDFLVTNDDYQPLFSVEYDGPLHQRDVMQRRRDRLKNSICSYFNHPMLRINSRYINRNYRGIDLLTYFVDAWFLRETFFEAQENGLIPDDEIFDIALFGSTGKVGEQAWPYNLSLDIQIKIHKLYEERKVAQMTPSDWIGVDKDNNYRCISWLALPDSQAICVTTGMRAQNYPAVMESDLVSQLAMFDLYDSLTKCIHDNNNNNDVAISRDGLIKRFKDFTSEYDMRRFFSCPPIDVPLNLGVIFSSSSI